MKITIAQLNFIVGDIEGNARKIIEVIKTTTSPIVIFPMGALCGAPLLDMEVDCEAALKKIVKHIKGEREIFMGVDEYRMAYLSSEGFDIIDGDGASTGEFAISLGVEHYRHGAPSRMRELLHDLGRTTVWVNAVGASTDTVYYGGSTVVWSSGEEYSLPLWREHIEEIDTDRPTNRPLEEQPKAAYVYGALVLAIGDFFAKNNFRDAIVALSGGLDSAVVTALAVAALGARRVRVLLLPSQYSSAHSVDDSLDMVRRCGIEHNIINIEPLYTLAAELLEPVIGSGDEGLAFENLQSRLRLVLTMAVSNHSGAIMLNTSNKSEAGVGYGTLYGDTSGALGVIADLYKTEVYELARYINTVAGDIIPDNIITKAPSAELRPAQFDTDSLPEYDVLDAILYRLVEGRMGVGQVVKAGFDKAVVQRVAQLLHGSDFKRRQLPPAVRLSDVTFGVEYVMPITKRCP